MVDGPRLDSLNNDERLFKIIKAHYEREERAGRGIKLHGGPRSDWHEILALDPNFIRRYREWKDNLKE